MKTVNFKNEQIKRGFWPKKPKIRDQNFWNLDIFLARLIWLYIKEFRKRSDNASEYDRKVLKKIQKAFRIISYSDACYGKKNMLKIREGLDLFSKHFLEFWT